MNEAAGQIVGRAYPSLGNGAGVGAAMPMNPEYAAKIAAAQQRDRTLSEEIAQRLAQNTNTLAMVNELLNSLEGRLFGPSPGAPSAERGPSPPETAASRVLNMIDQQSQVIQQIAATAQRLQRIA